MTRPGGIKGRVGPALVGIALALGNVLPVTQGASAATRQIALGISQIDYFDIDSGGADALDTATKDLGRKPAIWSLWSDWGGPNKDFPTAVANGLYARRVVPMVYWQPTDPSYAGFDCDHWALKNIIAGDHDAYIRQWAQAAKAFGHTVILRFAHEMNGKWYVWGNKVCGNTPKQFRQAWIHVWNVFRGPTGVGASNVKLLWSVYSGTFGSFFPGAKYVDYMGLTALNWGAYQGKPWTGLADIMAPTMTSLRKLSKTKPIIAAEVASEYHDDCAACDKAGWISQGYSDVYADWPQVVAIVYFNYNMLAVGQPDWRLATPAAALDAYRGIAADKRFQGTFPQH